MISLYQINGLYVGHRKYIFEIYNTTTSLDELQRRNPVVNVLMEIK